MKRTKYASDISREKFVEIEPLLRSVRHSTKPTTVDLYKVFCAVLYRLPMDLSGKRYAYVRVDGIYSTVRMDDRLCLLVIIGADGRERLDDYISL